MTGNRRVRLLALLLVAASPAVTLSMPQGGPPPQGAPIAEAMRGHFDRALEVHGAVVRGDVRAAGTHAEALAAQLEQGPKAGSPTAFGVLTEAAQAVRGASDVLAAAQATATMLGACGRCHRVSRVTPQFPAVSRIEPRDLAGKMQAHKAAADQLLLGLMVPSDVAWRTGAQALATAPMLGSDRPLDATLQPRLAATEEQLRRLAAEAVQVTDPRRREAFYAQFLAACADCHRAHRPRGAAGESGRWE